MKSLLVVLVLVVYRNVNVLQVGRVSCVLNELTNKITHAVNVDRSCVVWVGQGVCNDLCLVWLLTDRASSGSGKVCVMIYALYGC